MIKIFVGLLLISGLLGDAYARRHYRKAPVSRKAQHFEVLATKATLKDASDYTLTGGVVSPSNASYSFPYGDGVISRVIKKPGQRVKAGETILKIEPQGAPGEFATQNLTARISGVVLSLSAYSGEFVRKGEKLAVVAQEDKAVISINIAKLQTLKNTKSVSISNISEDIILSSKMESFNLVRDSETQAYKAYIELRCKTSCLPIFGKFAEVKLIKSSQKMVAVDKNAVDFDLNTVNVIVDGNTIKVQKIEVAKIEGDYAFLASGVKDGDSVVLVANTERRMKLQDGDTVTIKKERTSKN